jgi:hypothetical protein
MIHVKDHKQLDMFNPFAHLGPKRLALLESSWAQLFRDEILHKLPADKKLSHNNIYIYGRIGTNFIVPFTMELVSEYIDLP